MRARLRGNDGKPAGKPQFFRAIFSCSRLLTSKEDYDIRLFYIGGESEKVVVIGFLGLHL